MFATQSSDRDVIITNNLRLVYAGLSSWTYKSRNKAMNICHATLHKNWSFPSTISSDNVTKSAVFSFHLLANTIACWSTILSIFVIAGFTEEQIKPVMGVIWTSYNQVITKCKAGRVHHSPKFGCYRACKMECPSLDLEVVTSLSPAR